MAVTGRRGIDRGSSRAGDCTGGRICRGGHMGAGRDAYTRCVYDPPAAMTSTPPATAVTSTTYREALRMALRDAMQRDPRVFMMGEDVGRYGGTYAVSK